MGWTGDTSFSTVGASATFSSETSNSREYTLGTFTAPKQGMYKFLLYGSAGGDAFYYNNGAELCSRVKGGQGGYIEYYRELQAGEIVYVGAGGKGACAYAAASQATTTTQSLSIISASDVYCVAGGGGDSGEWRDSNNFTGHNCTSGVGGAGGGINGASGTGRVTGGTGGGQSGTSSYYGKGADGGWSAEYKYYAHGGYGGDGWYGGDGGAAHADGADVSSGGAHSGGGGGGSSYAANGVNATVVYNGTTYTNKTITGGGSTGDGYVVITFTQNPNGTPQPPTLRLNKTTADVLGETCYLSGDSASAGYSNSITKYTIYRNGVELGTISTSTTSFSNYAVIAPVDTNSSYSYTVTTTAQSTLGDGKIFTSTLSNPAVLSTTSQTAPTAPTNVMINNATNCYIGDTGLTELTISWNASIAGSYNPVKEYHIYKDDIFLKSCTTTSCSLLEQTDYVGSYKVVAVGLATNEGGPFSSPATITMINKPAKPEMLTFVSEVASKDVPLKWNSVAEPTGSSLRYVVWNKIGDNDTTVETVTTDLSYTFPIEKVTKGSKFNLYVLAAAYGSGGSYRISDINTIETGRVSEFSIPTTEEEFWTGIYDPASLLTGRQAHAYESISLNWAHATPAATSGNIFTYTLKCKIGSSAWNDIYTVSKAPADSDYSSNLHYNYSLANISSNTQVSFYVLIKDNYDTEVACPQFTVTKLAVPNISNVNSAITYRKAAISFTGIPTTNGLTDKLEYTIYFSYDEKEVQYGNGVIESDSGVVSGLSYEFKLEDGKTANTNTFLGGLYEKVITLQYPYPNGSFKIKLNYQSYPNCFTISNTNCTYNFLNEIKSAPKISLTMPTAHTSYANSGDVVRYSFSPIGWTDAAGGTSGANVVYSIASNYQVELINPQLPNTSYTTTMPTFIQDGTVIYTLSTRITYADGNVRTNTTTVSFSAARWCNTDTLTITNLRRKNGTVSGNYILPETLWRSSKYDNLTEIVLTVYNQDKTTAYAGSQKTVSSFTKLDTAIPFAFSVGDDGSDLTVCAKATCKNTSGNIISVFSVLYLIRSSAITMALRKGALGINVSDDFAPEQTDSTLFINAKTEGTSPTVVINENDDLDNGGEALRITKGISDCGGLVSHNGQLYGRKMGVVVKAAIPLAASLSLSDYVITNSNFIKTLHISLGINLNAITTSSVKKAARHLRIDNIVHDTDIGSVTIKYHVTKAPTEALSIPIMLSVVNIIDR